MISDLEHARLDYIPKLPPIFRDHGAGVGFRHASFTSVEPGHPAISERFRHTYRSPLVEFVSNPERGKPLLNTAVVFSGGQAPGGHNVIAGLYDGLHSLNIGNRLYGFLGGPGGLVRDNYKEITADVINPFRNTGGFDLIGSGRTKLETPEQFERVKQNLAALEIRALVVIGGDDSNTNAGILAEYYIDTNVDIAVVGCPKTIDGDLKNEWIEASFGFDTATKVFSELVGSIARDARSAQKYWHIIRLMGRSASHIALECALQTQPNVTIISEEVAAKRLTLSAIVEEICTTIVRRSQAGMDYGVVLVPEGLIEFIPEMNRLIGELNDLLAHDSEIGNRLSTVSTAVELTALGLSEESALAFLSLPFAIRTQLLMDRDPHGNVQVSKIETEQLLIEKIKQRLRQLRAAGEYKGKFSAQNHFFGYEGRCVAPSNFDANYCYSLGFTAAALLGGRKTGYIAGIRHLSEPVSAWQPIGIPIASMMTMEKRHGKEKPVIKKALVDLAAPPFDSFAANRNRWALQNEYIFPGPIQYFGPAKVADRITKTLELESKK